MIINQPTHLTVHKKATAEPYLTLYTSFESFIDFLILLEEFETDIFRVSYNNAPLLLPDTPYWVELYKKIDQQFTCIFSLFNVEGIFSYLLNEHMQDLEPRDATEDSISHMIFEEDKLKIFLTCREFSVDIDAWQEEGF